eukprot:CAMPEP_0177721022 /NCGR_PEP_ID=MMETSP0484_2-20121128/16925_1 /TAXON_ID=354590 /ORGANISM="Rhodomonas lens, Strain RHODO" /LENGTH=195 /DNA_ID=CAMNT_0019233299 /DNA_START=36 /DNA_END=623 /DNA_ORIENTATION=-
MDEMIIGQVFAPSSVPGKAAKKSKRPPSLTPGLYVPLVQQHSEMPVVPAETLETPSSPHTLEDKVQNAPAARHSCPAVLGQQSETTVSYFVREGASPSGGSFRKATGVLRNGEIVYMGEKFTSTKEFVDKIRTLDWDVEGEDIQVASCNEMESTYNISPRTGAMMDAMFTSVTSTGNMMSPPPSTPRQPASWPSA